MSSKNARDWAELYVKEVVNKYNPRFKIRPKSESKIFKLLKPIIKIVNPRFFESYVTTMFGVMWVPDTFFDHPIKHVLKVTAHEGIHEYCRKKMSPGMFEAMYLFPQNLFVPFMILSLFFSWIWIIPALIFLAPLPAPGRYALEMKGYSMNRIWNKYIFKQDEGFSDDHVVHQLSSFQTYWGTWPFKTWIYKDLNKPLDESEKGIADVLNFLKKHNFIKS